MNALLTIYYEAKRYQKNSDELILKVMKGKFKGIKRQRGKVSDRRGEII